MLQVACSQSNLLELKLGKINRCWCVACASQSNLLELKPHRLFKEGKTMKAPNRTYWNWNCCILQAQLHRLVSQSNLLELKRWRFNTSRCRLLCSQSNLLELKQCQVCYCSKLATNSQSNLLELKLSSASILSWYFSTPNRTYWNWNNVGFNTQQNLSISQSNLLELKHQQEPITTGNLWTPNRTYWNWNEVKMIGRYVRLLPPNRTYWNWNLCSLSVLLIGNSLPIELIGIETCSRCWQHSPVQLPIELIGIETWLFFICNKKP